MNVKTLWTYFARFVNLLIEVKLPCNSSILQKVANSFAAIYALIKFAIFAFVLSSFKDENFIVCCNNM